LAGLPFHTYVSGGDALDALLKLQLTVLLLVGIIVALLLISAIIGFIRRHRRKRERPILATVTRVELEATTWRSQWYVTAVWQDGASGKVHTFRLRSKYRPTQQIGETVRVFCSSDHPRRFRMDL
jgi:hypothetical protein